MLYLLGSSGIYSSIIVTAFIVTFVAVVASIIRRPWLWITDFIVWSSKKPRCWPFIQIPRSWARFLLWASGRKVSNDETDKSGVDNGPAR